MKAVVLAIKVNRKGERALAINKVKSENQVTENVAGYLMVGSTPSANQSLQQTGVVAVCFLQGQCAAAKLNRYVLQEVW